VPVFVAGLAVPVLAMVLHGALTGFSRWWYAIDGYRQSQRSALRNADWQRLVYTAHRAAPAMLPMLGVGVVAAVVVWRGRQWRAGALLGAWLGLAVVAFLLGGQFYRHYWVILAFPLGTLAGSAMGLVRADKWRWGMWTVALVGPVVLMAQALTMARSQIGARLDDDGRGIADEHIATWFAAHAHPGDQIYALCASAGLYGNIDADPPYPYLWFALISQVPGAQAKLIALVSGPHAPRFVAAYQSADACDPSGAVATALATRYRPVTTQVGIVVYELRSRM
jgi:hypothetical protein